MGVKTNYFRLGLFVVAAIAAAIASILILLGPSLGKPYAEMETYFQFSISGLEVGAPAHAPPSPQKEDCILLCC